MVFPRLTLGYCSPGRSSTYIKERYGPYVAGAYFILKQGGAVKYDGKGVTVGLGEAGERLSKPRALQSVRQASVRALVSARSWLCGWGLVPDICKMGW